MGRFRHLTVCSWLLLGVLVLLPGRVGAGGGPENVLLVVDPSSPVSTYVGHYYQAARGIPDNHVVYLEPLGGDYAGHVEFQQRAILGMIEQRGIASEIDYVVVPPGGGFYVPASGLVTDGCAAVNRFSASTVHTLSFVSEDVLGGLPSTTRNHFYAANDVARAFDSETRWSFGSPTQNASAPRYFIGALLGYDGLNGNSVDEIIAMIDRSVAADGARPDGTFYFMRTTDPLRSPPRDPYFAAAVSTIESNDGEAVLLDAVLPIGNQDALGIMTGWATPDIDGADLTLLPGAFADHLTSYAATFDNASQTKLSRWIVKGASGSVGAVEEPCNYAGKFPHPRVHVFYQQGASLGEAVLRSLEYLPFQGLLYGDPLTRPFAYLPQVSLPDLPLGPVRGVVVLTPEATTENPAATLSLVQLFVDGVKLDTKALGLPFVVDTSPWADGVHEVRVVVREASLVGTVGHWVGSLTTANRGHSVELGVAPADGDLSTSFAVTATASGGDVVELRLLRNERVLASSVAGDTDWVRLGRDLGAGDVRLIAEAEFADGSRARSAPVTVAVAFENPPSGAPGGQDPSSVSYSRQLLTDDPWLLELPGYDPEGADLSLEVLDGPFQATFSPTAGGGLLVPSLDACGDDTVVYRVFDGELFSDPATVTVRYRARPFIRGDFGNDGQLELADAVALLAFLFSGGEDPPVADAADVNGDGTVGLGDPVFLLAYLFQMGPPPPPPFPQPGC